MAEEALSRAPVDYPESDGRPMADNTLQFRWIAMLKGNLDALLPDFVAGDLLWYPVEGDNRIRVAPDVLVAQGRPKGERGSYQQWEEAGIAPQVVFEVLSPSNSIREMREKRAFYDRFGVDEYYVVDPEVEILELYLRQGRHLLEVAFEGSFVSPRLGVRFTRQDERLSVALPDGKPFLTFEELKLRADALEAERDAAAAERDAAITRADAAEARAALLAERLRALGIDPDQR
jgi:Uma2 family endonuclease